ncbi:MAG TPA: hypothetical protein VLB67_15180 [Acidimicrobiia bacterium]|nr:hypothetical protein [Acidimicrobiia bacterium]
MTRNLIRTISLSVGVLALAVAAAGWTMLGVLTALGSSSAATGETFETLHRTLDVSVETTATIRDAMTDLDQLVAAVAASSATTADFVEDTATITSERVAVSLAAIERSMPGLIEAGAVIDDTLTALSLFGVNYRPDVPFDEALAGIHASIDGLAGDVAVQGATLRSLVPEIEEIGATTDSLADRIAETRLSLEEAETLLSDYRRILSTTEQSVVSATGPAGLVTIGRLLSLVIGVAGVTLAVALWRVAPEAGPGMNHAAVGYETDTHIKE